MKAARNLSWSGIVDSVKEKKTIHYLLFLTLPGEKIALLTNTALTRAFQTPPLVSLKNTYLKVSTAGFSEVVGTDPVFSHSPRELWLVCPYLSSDFHLFLCATPYFYINCHITCISQATCFLLHCLPKWTLPQLSISYRSMSPAEQRAFGGNFHKSKRH